MSEIKPVAWRYRWRPTMGWAYLEEPIAHVPRPHPLYDQSAIDTLQARIRSLEVECEVAQATVQRLTDMCFNKDQEIFRLKEGS